VVQGTSARLAGTATQNDEHKAAHDGGGGPHDDDVDDDGNGASVGFFGLPGAVSVAERFFSRIYDQEHKLEINILTRTKLYRASGGGGGGGSGAGFGSSPQLLNNKIRQSVRARLLSVMAQIPSKAWTHLSRPKQQRFLDMGVVGLSSLLPPVRAAACRFLGVVLTYDQVIHSYPDVFKTATQLLTNNLRNKTESVLSKTNNLKNTPTSRCVVALLRCCVVAFCIVC
jgi:hypothetical protein